MRPIVMFIFSVLVWLSFCQSALATGDCDHDGIVTYTEVRSAIDMFLGTENVARCVDENSSGDIDIHEVQNTINTFIGLIPANSPPVANPVILQNAVFTGVAVTLDGSNSSDVNGDNLTFNWVLSNKPANSIATLSSSTEISPSFTPDLPGIYSINLVVNDGKLDSAVATVTINATAPYLELSKIDPFFGSVTILSLPYTVNTASSQTLTGIPTPTYATIDTFTLKAMGSNFTIENLSAADSTGLVVPYFSGLSNGQTISAGSPVTFSLRSPLTNNNTVSLSYRFTITETKQTFTYNVNLRTN
ncbi:hypothetical protein E4633_17140 [Geomonas terrae]|uniref:PKD domain-containing protein n=1 Tax=Geomonas terrae TaxID=2562681 RepID=A0A4S1CC43_9BACT|nr:Ig-like domain-containing protein [Geomonas terrae]TGU70723.1 hypothetical protein E4633_17140 [Geomonas terrae]